MKLLIMIHGQMRSGKDTLGSIIGTLLADKVGAPRTIKFADALKRDCERYFAPLVDEINARTRTALLNIPVGHPHHDVVAAMLVEGKNWYEEKTVLTRLLLQISGTEFARGADPDVWVKRMVKSVEAATEQLLICTDLRFENECCLDEYFNTDFAEGISIVRVKIVRGAAESTGISGHASEQSLPDDWFDFVVENNGTLEDLQQSAAAICLEILSATK